MSAARLQTPAPVQGRTHPSLTPQLLPADLFAGASTPLRQQSGGSATGLPAPPQQPPPAARVLSFGMPSPAGGSVAMADPDQQLELSEEALFQEDHDGQVRIPQRADAVVRRKFAALQCRITECWLLAVSHMCSAAPHPRMSCTEASDISLMSVVWLQQDTVAGAMSSESEDEAEPAQAARTPPAAAAEADSSDSSDEEISDEFAQAAELHRSASGGALTGAVPDS